MYDVICVGGSTVDVFAKTQYSELIKIMSKKGEEDFLAYPTGSKILVDQLDFTTGGGGTNVAVSLSKQGLKSAYLGCVGKDENAQIILQALDKYGVSTDLVVKKRGQTGYSIILDSIEHDRTILTHKGINNNLRFKDIDTKKLKTKWFFFSSLLDGGFHTQEKLAEFAKKHLIKVAFNPSSYLAEKGSHFLEKLLARTEMLILNKEEAEMIVGKDSIEYLVYKLNKLGPNYVVITNGKQGAYCYHNEYLYYAKTNNIRIVETTGAGDAFASSFLAGMIRRDDIESAMKIATTNAESVIQHHGAKNKLLSYREILSVLKNNPVKVTKKKLSL